MQTHLSNPICFSQEEKNNPRGVPDVPRHLPGWLGIDEAGRGCLAGPVVAAAVWLPAKCALPGLTDSKKISPKTRDSLAIEIKKQALAWSLGFIWPRDIDKYNILQATFMAMSRALASIGKGGIALQNFGASPIGILIDGNFTIPHSHLKQAFVHWGEPKNHDFCINLPQKAIVKGDARVLAIAAASVLAKTARDKFMLVAHRRYPGYFFNEHKGYGTQKHLSAIKSLGASALHRLSFRGCGQKV